MRSDLRGRRHPRRHAIGRQWPHGGRRRARTTAEVGLEPWLPPSRSSPAPLRLLPTRFKPFLKRLPCPLNARPTALAALPTLERLFRCQEHSCWPHLSVIPWRYNPSQVTPHIVAVIKPLPLGRFATKAQRACSEVITNPSSAALQDHIVRPANPQRIRHLLLSVPQPPPDPLQLSPRHSAPSLTSSAPPWAMIRHA
jgi:hypothetical protein